MSPSVSSDAQTFIALSKRFGGMVTSRPVSVVVISKLATMPFNLFLHFYWINAIISAMILLAFKMSAMGFMPGGVVVDKVLEGFCNCLKNIGWLAWAREHSELPWQD